MKKNISLLDKVSFSPKTAIISSLFISALAFAPFSSALAAGEGSGGNQYQGSHTGQGHGGSTSSGSHGQNKGGAKSVQDKVLTPAAEEGEEDSDRPAWAKGNREANPHPGGSMGSPEGSGTKKGDLFGDLWVVLRDNEGNPILDENGQVQPIIMVDGQLQVIHLVDPDGDGKYELPAEYADLVQEVELGRTNVARSPSKVLDHSLTEALSKLDGLTLDSSSSLTQDASGRLVVDGTAIDSPLENLALYKALLEATDTNNDGLLEVSTSYSGESGSGTYSFLVPTSDQLSLAASLLAAASDKTASLTVDRIVELNEILGTEDKLASLVKNYTYPGSTATYNDTTTYVSIQVAGQATPDDPTDDVFKTVSYNLITGASVEYDGQTYTVPGISFETVPNTVDENGDGILNVQDTGDLNGIDGFTQAVDDALQVLEFVHDNGV